MTAYTTLPSLETLGSVRAMACEITLQAARRPQEPHVVERALDVFTAAEAACTRFDASSPLMAVNAEPDRWHEVPRVLWVAVGAAYAAYLETEGRFDPRVFADLRRLGYDRTFAQVAADPPPAVAAGPRLPLGRWRPRFASGPEPALHLGGHPVDLGGIGKGLAVRWAAERLDGQVDGYVLDASGDGLCRGSGPDGGPWTVGVEHPVEVDRPIAVLGLTDQAYATSSLRLRRWAVQGGSAHHLIDPRTGLPGGAGLASVTAVADDPADAEVLTKTLFLHGPGGIGPAADRQGVAALWIDGNGTVGCSRAMEPLLVWRGW